MCPSARTCHAEKAIISNLVETHENLEKAHGDIDFDSPPGMEKISAFLEAIGEASDALGIARASRVHRDSFTSNYKALFPPATKNFHIDVLMASLDNPETLYVNGDEFEVSVLVIEGAISLQNAWTQFCETVQRHGAPGAPWRRGQGRAALDEVLVVLTLMDSAWACFEASYINELMAIEAKARSYIVKAVELEAALTVAEDSKINLFQKRQEFVASIAHMNSVANHVGKGRSDLDASILEAALAVQALDNDRSQKPIPACKEAIMLARAVTESFENVRAYLRRACGALERVDPHLSNNTGLVQRLVRWEETWEVGKKYMCRAPMLNAVGDIISEFVRMQQVVPVLEEMCDNQDVGFFLCLPRIIWLRFLASPDGCSELLKNLLPHRFPSTFGSLDNHNRLRCESLPAQLQSFRDRYESVCEQLLRNHPVLQQSDLALWELLARRAVAGTEGSDAMFDSFQISGTEVEAMKAMVDGLMNELEGWSLELQRHCAQEWNDCCALLLQCILVGRQSL